MWSRSVHLLLQESQAFGIDAVDTSKRWAEYANDLRGALDNVKEQLATAEDKTKTSEGVLRRALSLLKVCHSCLVVITSMHCPPISNNRIVLTQQPDACLPVAASPVYLVKYVAAPIS